MKILMDVFLNTLQSQHSIPWVSVAGLKNDDVDGLEAIPY